MQRSPASQRSGGPGSAPEHFTSSTEVTSLRWWEGGRDPPQGHLLLGGGDGQVPVPVHVPAAIMHCSLSQCFAEPSNHGGVQYYTQVAIMCSAVQGDHHQQIPVKLGSAGTTAGSQRGRLLPLSAATSVKGPSAMAAASVLRRLKSAQKVRTLQHRTRFKSSSSRKSTFYLLNPRLSGPDRWIRVGS